MAMNRFGLIPLRAVLLALGLMLAGAGTVTAGFKEGVEAYQRGDYAAAIAEWQPLAEASDVRSSTMLGYMYENGQVVKRNYDVAFSYYFSAAENGFAPAQNSLGLMYSEGLGTTTSFELAIDNFRKAASQGFVKAQVNLGNLLLSMERPSPDYDEAVNNLRLAANSGYPQALNSLGKAYLNGKGVDADRSKAIELFGRAGKQGDPTGYYNAALVLENGNKQDQERALTHYIAAATQGSIDAQLKLSSLYSTGRWVPKDIGMALTWMFIAGEPKTQENIGATIYKLATSNIEVSLAVVSSEMFVSASQQRAAACQHNGFADCLPDH